MVFRSELKLPGGGPCAKEDPLGPKMGFAFDIERASLPSRKGACKPSRGAATPVCASLDIDRPWRKRVSCFGVAADAGYLGGFIPVHGWQNGGTPNSIPAVPLTCQESLDLGAGETVWARYTEERIGVLSHEVSLTQSASEKLSLLICCI